jgi:hypothetical protein
LFISQTALSPFVLAAGQQSIPMATDTDELAAPKPRRRWFQFRLRTLFVVVALVAAMCGYLRWRMMAPIKVSAYLQVLAVEPTIWPPADKKIDQSEFESYKQHLAEFIKSPVVLNKALADRSIQALPFMKEHPTDMEEWLADQLVVESPGDSELMTISTWAVDTTQSAQIVNAVVTALMKEVVDKDRSDKLIMRDNLDRKFRAYQTQLLEREKGLSEIRDSQAPAAELQRQIADLQRLSLEARRAQIQAELTLARASKLAEGLAAGAPELKAAHSEVESARVDRDFWENKAEKLSGQISKLEEQLAAKVKFNGDAERLQDAIETQRQIIKEMSLALMRMNINLDAEPRVRALTGAGP